MDVQALGFRVSGFRLFGFSLKFSLYPVRHASLSCIVYGLFTARFWVPFVRMQGLEVRVGISKKRDPNGHPE